MSEIQVGIEKNSKQKVDLEDIIKKAPPIQTGHFIVHHGWFTRLADSLSKFKKKE